VGGGITTSVSPRKAHGPENHFDLDGFCGSVTRHRPMTAGPGHCAGPNPKIGRRKECL
jgi:hypothetical protein